ncbi:DNA cytosine methyltransferase [Janthinobacterium sp. UMAB-60]|uniref:DNA cytosine methyltransferase n=1 Tax=Janthinobacterium sp. UMAB-60 TaxID=1365365 RepID=UPI001C59D767|nr:DNA cytosine methyltransferase [Janthinobacterium sp. UMAB-60]
MKRDELPATPIRYLSLFSGIEAATVAWAPLGWVCVGVAEIENFPLRVLAHHYPNVPKLGDITKITEADIAALGRIDVMVFGSPCQDMSVAGKRKGMLNADGTVTRSGLFFAAFNIFQWARKHGGCRFALWENVPGAYSSSQGRDFASVVELLAGLDDVAVPVNGWGTEGCALGDNGLLEWACLDAQWFGVAQRRRRVFAVLDTGNWASRPPILLERQSMRGDTAPRRETGQDVAGTLSSRTTGGGGLGTDFECMGDSSPLYCLAHGQGGAELAIDRSPTLTCNHEAPIVAGTLTCGAKSAGSATQQDAEAGLLVPVIGFNAQQDPDSWIERSGPLAVNGTQAQAIAFSCKDHGADAIIELAPTMRAMGHAASHANAGGQLAVCITGDVTHCLKAEGFDASEDGTGRGQPIVTAFKSGQSEAAGGIFTTVEFAPTLQAQNNGSTAVPAIQYGMAVRRLTPTETERLQGFPDGYTAIPIKKYARKRVTKLRPESMWAKIDGNWWLLAADGPRYKSHGNSFAVPVVAWIGHRIDAAMRANFAHEREIARVA